MHKTTKILHIDNPLWGSILKNYGQTENNLPGDTTGLGKKPSCNVFECAIGKLSRAGQTESI